MIPPQMVLRCAKNSDGKSGNHSNDSAEMEMELKIVGSSGKIEKSRRFVIRPRIKVWMGRAITTVILWSCVVQLMALGEFWGPRLLKGMPNCFSHPDLSPPVKTEKSYVPDKAVLPPKSKFLPSWLVMLIFVVFFCEVGISFKLLTVSSRRRNA